MYRQFVDWIRCARPVLFFFSMLCMPAVALANSIVVGNHILQPNQPGQVVGLHMTGSDLYSALDIGMFINGGVAGAPVITHVFDTVAGTIPTPNLAGSIWVGGQAGVGVGFPDGTASIGTGFQTIAAFWTPGFAPSTAEGLLITLTFDTTGIAPGVYSFSLTEHPTWQNAFYYADDDFNPIPSPLNITNGTLTVVPEPTSLTLGLFAIGGLAIAAGRGR